MFSNDLSKILQTEVDIPLNLVKDAATVDIWKN